jgi:hypothetical protein
MTNDFTGRNAFHGVMCPEGKVMKGIKVWMNNSSNHHNWGIYCV